MVSFTAIGHLCCIALITALQEGQKVDWIHCSIQSNPCGHNKKRQKIKMSNYKAGWVILYITSNHRAHLVWKAVSLKGCIQMDSNTSVEVILQQVFLFIILVIQLVVNFPLKRTFNPTSNLCDQKHFSKALWAKMIAKTIHCNGSTICLGLQCFWEMHPRAVSSLFLWKFVCQISRNSRMLKTIFKQQSYLII